MNKYDENTPLYAAYIELLLPESLIIIFGIKVVQPNNPTPRKTQRFKIFGLK